MCNGWRKCDIDGFDIETVLLIVTFSSMTFTLWKCNVMKLLRNDETLSDI